MFVSFLDKNQTGIGHSVKGKSFNDGSCGNFKMKQKEELKKLTTESE